MKLISAELHPMNETNFASYIAPEYSRPVREAANVLMHNRGIDQYIAYEAGVLLTDDGLVPAYAETLSMNDDHVLDDDLEYISKYCTDNGMQFITVWYWTNGVLAVLYFTA